MTECWKVLRLLCGSAVSVAVCVTSAAAQVTPAAGYVPPDDTPSIRVGVTIFADYTVQTEPKIKDVDGNDVTFNSFNIAQVVHQRHGQHLAHRGVPGDAGHHA